MRTILGVSFQLEGIYLFPVALARETIGLDCIQSNTFFFSFELISRAILLGYDVITTSIQPLPRKHGSSKVANLRYIGRVAKELLSFRAQLFREGRWRLPRTPNES